MAKTKLRKDDYVMIIAGKDKGKTAQIILVDTDKNRVFVEGNNLSSVNTKAVKARKASEQSGLIKRPGSVHISNVLPVCSSCGKVTRIGVQIIDDKKVRVCKKCGAVLITKKAAAKATAKATVRKKTAIKKAEADSTTPEVSQVVEETAPEVAKKPESNVTVRKKTVKAVINETEKVAVKATVKKKIEKTVSDEKQIKSDDDK